LRSKRWRVGLRQPRLNRQKPRIFERHKVFQQAANPDRRIPPSGGEGHDPPGDATENTGGLGDRRDREKAGRLQRQQKTIG